MHARSVWAATDDRGKAAAVAFCLGITAASGIACTALTRHASVSHQHLDDLVVFRANFAVGSF